MYQVFYTDENNVEHECGLHGNDDYLFSPDLTDKIRFYYQHGYVDGPMRIAAGRLIPPAEWNRLRIKAGLPTIA